MDKHQFDIGCTKCKVIIGTVFEIEDRPGFYHNEYKSKVSGHTGKACLVCKQPFSRINLEG